MPLLLAYLKSVPPGHTNHLAKACYALENFVENLGRCGREGTELSLWMKGVGHAACGRERCVAGCQGALG